VTVSFRVDPRVYALTGTGRIVRIDEEGSREIGTFADRPVPLSVRLPASGALVFELRRDGRR
jgi:hypothetical protein